jgi:hypothetical protein
MTIVGAGQGAPLLRRDEVRLLARRPISEQLQRLARMARTVLEAEHAGARSCAAAHRRSRHLAIVGETIAGARSRIAFVDIIATRGPLRDGLWSRMPRTPTRSRGPDKPRSDPPSGLDAPLDTNVGCDQPRARAATAFVTPGRYRTAAPRRSARSIHAKC